MITLVYYHRDGSQTVSRVKHLGRARHDDRELQLEAVRIVALHEDGSIVLVKDRWQGVTSPRELVGALPILKVQA